jgi:hypothetical protein
MSKPPAMVALSFDPADLARSVFFDGEFVRKERRRTLIFVAAFDRSADRLRAVEM